MLVYLYELDSVRNSVPEILIGQRALFEEIYVNGNQVVLSFNQITDSMLFMELLGSPDTSDAMFQLFKKGVLKITGYGSMRTPSQYLQKSLEKFLSSKETFIFSALPIRPKDRELAEKIQKVLQNDDMTLLQKERDQYETGSAEWERLEYLYQCVKLVLWISMECTVLEPRKMNRKQHQLTDYIRRVCDFGLHSENELLQKACELLDGGIVAGWGENRSEWLKRLDSRVKTLEMRNVAKLILDLCYNYAVEDGIAGISRHYKDDDEESFRKDFAERFERYYWEYEIGIHSFYPGDNERRGQYVNLWKHPGFDSAVRMCTVKYEGEAGEKLYEECYKREQRRWRRQFARKDFWKAIAVLVYCGIFIGENKLIELIGEKVLDALREDSGIWLSFIAPSAVIYILTLLVASGLQKCTSVPDIVESIRMFDVACKDLFRKCCAPRALAYQRCQMRRTRHVEMALWKRYKKLMKRTL